MEPTNVTLQVTHTGGRVEYIEVSEGPAYDYLIHRPMFSTWVGTTGTEYVRVP